LTTRRLQVVYRLAFGSGLSQNALRFAVPKPTGAFRVFVIFV